MTDVDNAQDIRFGLHATAADLTSTPGTLVRLTPLAETSGLRPRRRERFDRSARLSADNRPQRSGFGVKNLDPISVALELRGSNSVASGALVPANNFDFCLLLNQFFGAAAASIAGSDVNAAGGTPATGVLTLASAGAYANGNIIVFSTASGLVAREIVSGAATTTLTLDRAYDGAPTLTPVMRMARWNVNTALFEQIHGYIFAEGQSWARAYFGLACDQLVIAAPEAGPCTLTTQWQVTDWDDAAEIDAAFVEPVAGAVIMGNNADFRIGNTSYLVRSLSVTMSPVVAARVANNGVNGRSGFVYANKHAMMIEATLYVGDNALALNELQDDAGTPELGDTILGDEVLPGTIALTADVGLQLGRQLGGVAYIRLPAAELVAAGPVTQVDGMATQAVQFMARMPAAGSPFRLGVR